MRSFFIPSQSTCGGLDNAPTVLQQCYVRECEAYKYDIPRYGSCSDKCSTTLGRLDRIPNPSATRVTHCQQVKPLVTVDYGNCAALKLPIPLGLRDCNTHSCYAEVCTDRGQCLLRGVECCGVREMEQELPRCRGFCWPTVDILPYTHTHTHTHGTYKLLAGVVDDSLPYSVYAQSPCTPSLACGSSFSVLG